MIYITKRCDYRHTQPEVKCERPSSGPNAQEKTVHYDNATRWLSQEHGSKKVTDIGATLVNDGDRVVVLGARRRTKLSASPRFILPLITPFPAVSEVSSPFLYWTRGKQ